MTITITLWPLLLCGYLWAENGFSWVLVLVALLSLLVDAGRRS